MSLLPADGSAAAAAAAGVSENLLTACRFYDRECAGYLADEDLEEIAYMVSDNLSSEWQQVSALWVVVTQHTSAVCSPVSVLDRLKLPYFARPPLPFAASHQGALQGALPHTFGTMPNCWCSAAPCACREARARPG